MRIRDCSSDQDTRRIYGAGHAVLYLAVSDIKVDSQRLEGVGVQPTVEIVRPLEYAAGRDPQLEKAIEILVEDRATGKADAPK